MCGCARGLDNLVLLDPTLNLAQFLVELPIRREHVYPHWQGEFVTQNECCQHEAHATWLDHQSLWNRRSCLQPKKARSVCSAVPAGCALPAGGTGHEGFSAALVRRGLHSMFGGDGRHSGNVPKPWVCERRPNWWWHILALPFTAELLSLISAESTFGHYRGR